jgi:hypothetical protein
MWRVEEETVDLLARNGNALVLADRAQVARNAAASRCDGNTGTGTMVKKVRAGFTWSMKLDKFAPKRHQLPRVAQVCLRFTQ